MKAPNEDAAADYDRLRIAALLTAAGLPPQSAVRIAASFDQAIFDTLETLFCGNDFLLDTRGGIILSVLGAILVRRAGRDPLDLAPEVAKAAGEWDARLGEAVYGPFVPAARLDALRDHP